MDLIRFPDHFADAGNMIESLAATTFPVVLVSAHHLAAPAVRLA
jgi:hypothetical protein